MSTELMIGHRGYSLVYPENTIRSFREAVNTGLNCIELDVVISSDGVPYIMHDDTLDRTTDGTGNCYDVTWSYVQGLDAGSWKDIQFAGEPVPTLEQVLDYFKDKNKFILIEMKFHTAYGVLNLPEIVAELITSKDMINQCFVFSFDSRYVDRVRSYNSNIITGYLSSSDPTTVINSAVNNGHKFVSFEKSLITQQIVENAHTNNLKINAWTVDIQSDIQNFIDMGCDWISGNDALLLKSVADTNYIVQILPIYTHEVVYFQSKEKLEIPVYTTAESELTINHINGIRTFKLVDTTDAKASCIRIMTNNGIKAIST